MHTMFRRRVVSILDGRGLAGPHIDLGLGVPESTTDHDPIIPDILLTVAYRGITGPFSDTLKQLRPGDVVGSTIRLVRTGWQVKVREIATGLDRVLPEAWGEFDEALDAAKAHQAAQRGTTCWPEPL